MFLLLEFSGGEKEIFSSVIFWWTIFSDKLLSEERGSSYVHFIKKLNVYILYSFFFCFFLVGVDF